MHSGNSHGRKCMEAEAVNIAVTACPWQDTLSRLPQGFSIWFLF